MNNGTNRHDRVEDEEPDYPWKTMSRWLEAGLLQSLRHSDYVHSFRILTPISTSPSIVSTLRSLRKLECEGDGDRGGDGAIGTHIACYICNSGDNLMVMS
ncbi:hypothetical protein E3N88_13821 [Mikania micrantha]|uniref:Uncharacterized protein n=1 Tax=Mikania micrantha TaxID=192012 RepID=A0A5N6P1D1_9ASTR|nr:hypothetical protein E3N88_13821 [Mikania micrantha]